MQICENFVKMLPFFLKKIHRWAEINMADESKSGEHPITESGNFLCNQWTLTVRDRALNFGAATAGAKSNYKNI